MSTPGLAHLSADALTSILANLKGAAPDESAPKVATRATQPEPTARAQLPALRPQVCAAVEGFVPGKGTREGVLASKRAARRVRTGLQAEYRATPKADPERPEMLRWIEDARNTENQSGETLASEFVPMHSPGQLIGPQQLLMSRLFNVQPKTLPRAQDHTFEAISTQHGSFGYEGPELRQSDGLVFMALVNMVRDFKLGTLVSFDAAEMCQWLYGYYDGPGRTRLRQAIHRLQHALLIFNDFSVQLAMRFHFPARGRWTVMLDPAIVTMFRRSQVVWLDFELRKSLPDGLTTWLYAYVEGQTTLIPQRIELLREMCGSASSDNRTFNTTLTRALRKLVEVRVIEDGWAIDDGVLHWRKELNKPTPGAALA